jgi:hypothetical protein
MNARETAERHGASVASGNMQAAMADFTPDALQAFAALGVRPPRGTNAYELLSERQDGDHYVYDIKYSNGQDSTTIRSTWSKLGDEWKLVKAEGAS